MTPAVCAQLLQSCQTLCDPVDCSPPCSYVPGDSPGKNFGVGCQLPCPPLGDLPDPGIEPTSPEAPALSGGFFITEPPGWPPFEYL